MNNFEQIVRSNLVNRIFGQDDASISIWYGDKEICQTKEEADELTDFIRNYIVAKLEGKTVMLIVEDQRPKNQVIDQMNAGDQ